MLELLGGVALGYLACKFISPIAESLGLPISTGPGRVPPPRTTPGVVVVTAPSTPRGVPTAPASPRPAAAPVLTSTAPAYPSAQPRGLPPFPSGWKYAKTSPVIVQRAQVLLRSLRSGEKKQETAPDGRWITYWKQTQGGKTNVTAWEPKVPLSNAITT